jgi:ABC-type Fe3+-hydroxamate transport system substrate-binding protein
VLWIGLACAALLSPLACERQEAPVPTTATAPQRVASLSPLATHLLLELDALDRIVAVDVESAALPGLAGRPKIPAEDDEALLRLRAVEPDWVVLPETRAELAARLAAANLPTVVVAVHDFDDGFTLWGDLAGRLGRAEAARPRIAAASRPFAEIAAESHGDSRPRVAAIDRFEPLALVGDHRFATALIEIAGGENVTHGATGATATQAMEPEALRALAPALLVHASPRPVPASEQQALTSRFADVAPLVFVELDPDRFFAPETVEAARRLRTAIAQLARPRAETR